MATSSTRCWDCGIRLYFDDEEKHADVAISEHRGYDCSRVISNNYYSPRVAAIKSQQAEKKQTHIMKRQKKKQ